MDYFLVRNVLFSYYCDCGHKNAADSKEQSVHKPLCLKPVQPKLSTCCTKGWPKCKQDKKTRLIQQSTKGWL